MAFAIKAAVRNPRAKTFAFVAQKTMYGGKRIASGDAIFVFASENDGGQGLVARGIVTSARALAKTRGLARQTPRVSITISRTALAKQRLGRSELEPFTRWRDGRPETELNFKFHRQATNKIVGISDGAAAFLNRFFAAPSPRLGRAIPVVFVADVRASARFYRDTLGYSIDFLHGQPPFYGSVSRDGACMHLKFVHEPVIAPGSQDRESLIMVFTEVDDVDALFAEYVAAGATFTQRLQNEAWGGRDFIVRDPDGNMICFAGRSAIDQ